VRLQVTAGDDKSGVLGVPLFSVGWEGGIQVDVYGVPILTWNTRQYNILQLFVISYYYIYYIELIFLSSTGMRFLFRRDALTTFDVRIFPFEYRPFTLYYTCTAHKI